MKVSIRPLLLALTLTTAGLTQAAPVIGTGGGYYGSAWFTGSNGGVVVGPHATWTACDNALQSAIDYRVTNWGWTVASYSGCGYRPPFAGVFVHSEVQVQIDADTPQGSLEEATAVSDRLRAIRRQFNADAYDAALHGLR